VLLQATTHLWPVFVYACLYVRMCAAGEDFDVAILNHLITEFKKDQGIDLSNDRLAMQRLREVRVPLACAPSGVGLLGCACAARAPFAWLQLARLHVYSACTS